MVKKTKICTINSPQQSAEWSGPLCYLRKHIYGVISSTFSEFSQRVGGVLGLGKRAIICDCNRAITTEEAGF